MTDTKTTGAGLANVSVKDTSKLMHERRYEFVLTLHAQSWPYADRWQCTLGDYDLDAPIASAVTPQEAMAEWLELHGDTLDQ